MYSSNVNILIKNNRKVLAVQNNEVTIAILSNQESYTLSRFLKYANNINNIKIGDDVINDDRTIIIKNVNLIDTEYGIFQGTLIYSEIPKVEPPIGSLWNLMEFKPF